jgi:hypothetical protein
MATHELIENVVISNKINDILTTGINLNNYLTIDNSLTEEAGMKKEIITYTSNNNVKQVGMGNGNGDEALQVSKSVKEYEVLTYQGRFDFFDEEEMKNPIVVDTGLKHSADNMINKFTELAIAEYEGADNVPASAWSFDVIVDAIAKMNLEDEAGLFLLISPEDKAGFRKALKDDLSYSEAFVRTGYIGTVCGVPVIVSKAVPAGKGYLATKDAITLFIKKDTETEYERDADTRKNSYWVRKVAVVALTDTTKAVKITIAG